MVITYRNGIRIIGDILTIVNEHGICGVNITNLLTKANISYTRLSKLSKQLVSAGLLEERNHEGQHLYIITDKGKKYLEMYQQFQEFTNLFGLKL